jgi:hypothetical protein
MPANGPEPTSGRETRLLVLVVVVSLAVLLLLARFQFPEANIATVNPSAGPLAGMAARATFEEMSATLAGLLTRAAPSVEIVRLEPLPADEPGAPARPSEPSSTPPAAPVGPRFGAAIRLRSDLAILHVPAGWRPVALRDESNPIEVVFSDTDREVVVVRLPSPLSPGVSPPAAASGAIAFLYVALIQATRSGPTIQPAFVGRTDIETDARWSAPLLVVRGNASVPIGALVYAIDGRLIGLASRHEAGVAIVPAAALDDAMAQLTSGGASNE